MTVTTLLVNKKVKCLYVINNAAERGLALTQEFNRILTIQEEQKHCNDFKNPYKSVLIAALTELTRNTDTTFVGRPDKI